MKDTELRARLLQLGMTPAKADEFTRQIRDVLQPVATVAAARMAEHLGALEQFKRYGDAGLSGYEIEGVSGLLKSIKKVAKGVVKVAKKVAAPIAAVAFAPVTGGASIAAYGAVKAAKIGKKASDNAVKAQLQIAAPQIAEQAKVLPVTGSAPKTRPKLVKRSVAQAGAQVAAQAVQQGLPADPAALMQALLANQGASMVSPAAQSVVREAAAQGVEQTAAGPSALPSWALPVGIAAAGLLLVLGRKK